MNRSTLAPCYRTAHEKFATYQSDGTGRDSYIMFGDGGLQPEPFRRGIKGRDGFSRDTNLKGGSAAPQVAARLVKGMG